MLVKLLCFLAPMMVGIEFDLAGGLFAAEIVLPICACTQILFKKNSGNDKYFQITIIIGIVYLFGLFVSDIWNQSSYDQYSRGWARVVVFLINFSSIYILVDNHRSRLLLFAAGLAAGRIWLSLDTFDGEVIAWKLGLAKPITLLLFIALVIIPFLNGPRNFLSPILLILVGFANIVADFRSLGGVLIVVGALMGFSALTRSVKKGGKGNRASPALALTVVAFFSVTAAYYFYSYAADNDWLSERGKDKFETQVEQSDAPLLIAGRNELLVSLEAIMDAPILGHGSWPDDPYYAEKLASLRYDYGFSNAASSTSDLIPTHSHLFGGWVEAGLAGGGFWTLILFLVGRALSRSIQGHSHMRPLYIYCSVLLIWDILFSPFAGFRRVESAFLIIVVLRALLQRTTTSRMKAVTRKLFAKRKVGGEKKTGLSTSRSALKFGVLRWSGLFGQLFDQLRCNPAVVVCCGLCGQRAALSIISTAPAQPAKISVGVR